MQDLHENHNVSILMVTHDAFSASYCERILFIQDGLLYKELNRQGTREFLSRHFRCARSYGLSC